MKIEQLKTICIFVFGYGWQSKLARYLGVNSRTVRRWVAGEIAIPPTVQATLRALANFILKSPDTWIDPQPTDDDLCEILRKAEEFIHKENRDATF